MSEYKVPALNSSDRIAPARLGSGTRDGSKFLRDDGAWETPTGGDGASDLDDLSDVDTTSSATTLAAGDTVIAQDGTSGDYTRHIFPASNIPRWTAGLNPAVGDVVTQNNLIYLCIASVPAGSRNNGPNGVPNSYLQVSNFIGDWVARWYQAGTVCLRDVSGATRVYIAAENIVGGDPAPESNSNTKWIRVDGGGTSAAFSIDGLTAVTTLADGDDFPFADASNSNANRKVSAVNLYNYIKGKISGLAASVITSGTFSTARIPGLPASQIISGVFSAARLGSGTAGSTKVLYGDSTWKDAPVSSNLGSLTEILSTNITVANNSTYYRVSSTLEITAGQMWLIEFNVGTANRANLATYIHTDRLLSLTSIGSTSATKTSVNSDRALAMAISNNLSTGNAQGAFFAQDDDNRLYIRVPGETDPMPLKIFRVG